MRDQETPGPPNRDPDSRFKFPAESRNGGSLFPGQIGKRPGIPSPFPGQKLLNTTGNLKTGDPIPDSRVTSVLVDVRPRALASKFGSTSSEKSVPLSAISARQTPRRQPHPASAGPCQFKRKVGGGLNLHLRDFKLRRHPAQVPGSCLLYSHRRVPPISRIAANRAPRRFPVPGRIAAGNGGFPDSRFPADRESEVPSESPVSRPNRESGERELGISGSASRFLVASHCQSHADISGVSTIVPVHGLTSFTAGNGVTTPICSNRSCWSQSSAGRHQYGR